MSVLEKIKSWMGGSGSDDLGDPSGAWLVIDGSSFQGGSGGRERPTPRDQFEFLKRIATFVEKEKLSACIILVGRPLREAAEASTFKTLRVHYVEAVEDLPKRALALVRGKSVIITQHRELESLAQDRGIEVMRVATFRKAMEDNGRTESGREGGTRNRRRRPRRGGRSAEKGSSAPKEKAVKDDVSDLIDLV